MKRTIIFILAVQISGCHTKGYEGLPLPEEQVVRLTVQDPLAGQLVLRAATIGLFNWGSWSIQSDIDGKTGLYRSTILPGVHIVSATAKQSALKRHILVWHCKGSTEFDIRPGSYELVFNDNKDNPEFRIDDEASGTTVATFPCKLGKQKLGACY